MHKLLIASLIMLPTMALADSDPGYEVRVCAYEIACADFRNGMESVAQSKTHFWGSPWYARVREHVHSTCVQRAGFAKGLSRRETNEAVLQGIRFAVDAFLPN